MKRQERREKGLRFDPTTEKEVPLNSILMKEANQQDIYPENGPQDSEVEFGHDDI